jgi:hypothetical protein
MWQKSEQQKACVVITFVSETLLMAWVVWLGDEGLIAMAIVFHVSLKQHKSK